MKKILSILILLFSLALSQIDLEESYISYKGTHPLHSWEGISKNISFNMQCTGDQCVLDVSAPLESFDSGNDGRDNNMLYYTESLQYPEVHFKSESFKFTGNFDTSIDVKGELIFHGVTREIPIKIVLYKCIEKPLWESFFKIILSWRYDGEPTG